LVVRHPLLEASLAEASLGLLAVREVLLSDLAVKSLPSRQSVEAFMVAAAKFEESPPKATRSPEPELDVDE